MSLIPRWFSHFPKPSQFFNDLEVTTVPSGLSVSSDEKHIFVEAHVPGLSAGDVEVTIDDDNVLWIKGDKKEEKEDKEKKFYRRSQTSFSYCVPLWEEIDENVEPKAKCKDGVMRITFARKKAPNKEGKKIEVKD